MTNPTITFTSWGDTYTLTPEVSQYANGRLAITMMDEEGPFTKLTVNLPDEHLNEGEFFVKDWSENAPLAAYLVEQGWLVPTGREVSSGYIFPMVARAGGALAEYLEEVTS